MTSLIAANNLKRREAGLFDDGHKTPSIAYSDGAKAEAYLRDVLTNASDLSSRSSELHAKAIDWASEYHLSPLRANLLRAVNLSKMSRVLELGCGCGAITRYLGEQGLEVDAVEGSRVRAELAALRCRGLNNVNVVSANFNDLKFPESTYDAVFLIGVTEYAKRFSQKKEGSDEESVTALLQTAKRALAPGGMIVIAIENRTGLKYMLGTHEDHHGKRYIGIHNYHPDSAGMRTYDKSQWQRILKNAGIVNAEFLLPFPDYKLPTVVLAERYAQDNPYAYCHLDNIRSRDYVLPLELERPESLFWEALSGANTLADHANSFLIVVSDDPRRVAEVCDKDFAHLPEFQRPAVLSCIVSKKRDELVVDRVRITDPHATQDGHDLGGIVHRVGVEPFHRGTLLSIEWARSLLIEEEVGGFESCLSTYHRFLADYRAKQRLPIDILPANIVVTPEGEYAVFDQEWEVDKELDGDFVFFRAIIWFALRYHQRQALEVIRRRLRIEDVRSFVKYAFNTVGRAIGDELLEKYLQTEQDFQSRIKGTQSDPIALDSLLVGERPVAQPISRVYWRTSESSYTEQDCRTLHVSVSSDRQTLSYDLPVDANSMTHFRFDPCEVHRPQDFGFMHIYGVQVFLCGNEGAECIWKVEGAETIAEQARLSGLKFHHTSLGSVFAVTDDDPWLEFDFIPRRLPKDGDHYRVTIDATFPRSAEYILARDRYLVKEEIMSTRLRVLEERLADKQEV
ncbi:MAG: class I SAM-dependent methyltransferase, partial [Gammaproteobacteria bacterium]|nr:class I SAM-dependent methyltransferase [Gammaproteobacteria bacterium]